MVFLEFGLIVPAFVAIKLQSQCNETLFLVGQPRRGYRIVAYKRIRNKSDHNREKTFQDKNPPPAAVPSDPYQIAECKSIGHRMVKKRLTIHKSDAIGKEP
jgi:hypothetical protein